jgi:hypothetical protein
MPLHTSRFVSRYGLTHAAEPSKPKLPFELVLKFNKCHADNSGQFCDTSGGTGGKESGGIGGKEKETANFKKTVPKDGEYPVGTEQDPIIRASVKRRYMAGEIELADEQKEFFGIGPEVKFNSKAAKVTKPSAKPSDVKSEDGPTQVFLDASTPEGITTALKAMGWKDKSKVTNRDELFKIAENNGKIAEKGRKLILEALESSPRGKGKVKVTKASGIDQKTADKLQANVNLLLHPTILKQLKSKSTNLTRGRSSGDAHYSHSIEGQITFGHGMNKNDQEAIYVHEFGHRIEVSVKGLLAKATKARDKAVSENEPLVNEYSEKVYEHIKGTEYVSSGYEHYFRDPISFAAKAPKHFTFIHRLVTRGELV